MPAGCRWALCWKFLSSQAAESRPPFGLQIHGEVTMPTDVALALMRKAEMEARASKTLENSLVIVCLWALVGLVLAVLMSRLGFDVEITNALATAG